MSRLEDQNVRVNVSPISGKLGLLLASHSLNNSGDLLSNPPVMSHLEPGVSCCQYYASNPLSEMSYTCSTVDMSNECSGL